jgi:MHS family alpha-ketoglutarate permease-like MFS transporter
VRRLARDRLLPTYAQIGALAPACCWCARLFQGLSVGGEYGTSATYMSEVALKGRRGFFASFQYVTLIGGQLLRAAGARGAATVAFHRRAEGLGLARAVRDRRGRGAGRAALRKSLDETRPPKGVNARRPAACAGCGKHKGAFMTVLGFTAGGSLIFYTFTTYMQKYLVNTAGMHAKTASNVMTGALFVYMVMQPVFGALSDRIGRRVQHAVVRRIRDHRHGALLHALKDVTSPYAAFVSGGRGAGDRQLLHVDQRHLIKAEMFPPEVRALGVGLSYAVANAIFGGSAEYVALWLKSVGTSRCSTGT